MLQGSSILFHYPFVSLSSSQAHSTSTLGSGAARAKIYFNEIRMKFSFNSLPSGSKREREKNWNFMASRKRFFHLVLFCFDSRKHRRQRIESEEIPRSSECAVVYCNDDCLFIDVFVLFLFFSLRFFFFCLFCFHCSEFGMLKG